MTLLTSDQEQIILGTLLGNGRLEMGLEGPYLLMKSRDPLWLEGKALLLAEVKHARWRSRSNYYWRSREDSCFERFDKLCYSGYDKVARMEILDTLRNIGLMVWYGDVGCLVGRKRCNACLRTQSLGKSNEVARRYFNEVRLPCNINLVRQKPVIVFSYEGTRMLMKVVGSVLPRNRYHLIPSLP